MSVASSATSLLIGHIAGNTSTIRVSSGGIMLPNHSPLVVAEQFGTLETLYSGRIDLGLGRAPGSDQATALAIRGENMNAAFHFPQNVALLQHYLRAIIRTGSAPFPARVWTSRSGYSVPAWTALNWRLPKACLMLSRAISHRPIFCRLLNSTGKLLSHPVICPSPMCWPV
ncbi:luciferase family oxidoreductase, group 1 [Mucilaginibacter gossypii]|uniref:Luciferase family oxidoreductase, group 1 n=1 Tax=Mucilaginibacter gossypii TaxID=551996 RepID=A0A1G8N936_9SPHI|nr:luciferase family oxidoreductase, group 1 [Mucilaginibacter gossypii]